MKNVKTYDMTNLIPSLIGQAWHLVDDQTRHDLYFENEDFLIVAQMNRSAISLGISELTNGKFK